jgi:hypothetical protein
VIAWFYDGRVPAAILAIMVAEFFFLVLFRPAVFRALWPSLCAGGFLLLAWLAAAAGAWFGVIALALLLAGCCHALDVVRRWR